MNLELSLRYILQQIDSSSAQCSVAAAAHSANFDKNVHKPQSKSYGRIAANIQFIFTHILWIWILLSVHYNFLVSEGLSGSYIDALNQSSSKLMTLILRGGLWTFLSNLSLCAAAASDGNGQRRRGVHSRSKVFVVFTSPSRPPPSYVVLTVYYHLQRSFFSLLLLAIDEWARKMSP